MKHIRLFCLITSILSFTACKTTSVIQQAPAPVQNESKAKEVSGMYLGMLPCADCSQLIIKLVLNPDHSYHQSLTYMGKSDSIYESSGTYGFANNGDIVLEQKTDGMQYFRINEAGLLMLDKDGKVISGTLADKYQLQKTKRTTGPDPFRNPNNEKFAAGTEFYARGNEPGWSLEMDKEKGYTFRTQDGTIVNTPAVSEVISGDSKTVSCRAVTEANELSISITDAKCSDSMSGEKFSHQVTVEWKRTSETEVKKFSGCGRYTMNPELQGKWKLTALNGVAVDTTGLSKGPAVLELDILKGRLTGHGGCNVLSGTFYASDAGEMTLSPLATTRMACPGMEKENTFTGLLSGAILTYQVKSGSLVLKSGDGKFLVFKKIP